ncbi:class II aldolase/adducin family protein [Oscillospiraceae bacterium WX1]
MSPTAYPTDQEAKRAIIEAGQRLYQKGLVCASDGNLSARVSPNHILATPSGVCKGFLTEDMLIKLDLDGSVLEGTSMPSSEIKMHLNCYKQSPDVLAVVHAHPPSAAVFAAAGLPLDTAILQETVVLLGVVPLVPFALPGSDDLADGVSAFVQDYHALLLEHHGAVAWGQSVNEALERMERVEYTATVTLLSKMLGITRAMTEKQIDALLALRPMWGITGGGRPLGRDDV